MLIPLGFQKADKVSTIITAKLRHAKDVYEPVFEIHITLVSSDTFGLPVEAQNFLTRWTFEDKKRKKKPQDELHTRKKLNSPPAR